MSEGVNLQQASAIILLDMPSVMRIAEQRIGRIDRMDSPHDEIKIYWPDDHPEFALKTDKKFFKTAQVVKNLLGSNIDVPKALIDVPEALTELITAADAQKLYEENEKQNAESFSDGIQDAFQLVKELVYGENPLINLKTYNSIKKSDATIISNVSLVKSTKPFGFFAIRGFDFHAPYWIYIELEEKNIIKDLPIICEHLRLNLINAENIDIWTDDAQQLLDNFIKIIKENEINNLPNKKRRAIELLRNLVNIYWKKRKKNSMERNQLLHSFMGILHPNSTQEFAIDYYQLAQQFLDMIQPLFIEEKTKRKTIIHLGKMLKVLKKNTLSDEDLMKLKENIQTKEHIDKYIASCIIGIHK